MDHKYSTISDTDTGVLLLAKRGTVGIKKAASQMRAAFYSFAVILFACQPFVYRFWRHNCLNKGIRSAFGRFHHFYRFGQPF